MRAFLLAAGLGTRLRPLTEKTPKPLLPVGGVPLIFFALARLRRHDITQVGINLHHLGEQIPALLGDGAKLGLRIRYFREEKLLGTGGAIRNAREFLEGEPFLLWNADTILDIDLGQLIAAHREHAGVATLALSSRASVEEFGGLRYDELGKIRGLQAAGVALADRAAVFAGASILDPEIFSFLERGGETPCILRQGVLPAIEAGKAAHAWICDGYFADLGTVKRLEEVNAALEAKREPFALWSEAQRFIAE